MYIPEQIARNHLHLSLIDFMVNENQEIRFACADALMKVFGVYPTPSLPISQPTLALLNSLIPHYEERGEVEFVRLFARAIKTMVIRTGNFEIIIESEILKNLLHLEGYHDIANAFLDLIRHFMKTKNQQLFKYLIDIDVLSYFLWALLSHPTKKEDDDDEDLQPHKYIANKITDTLSEINSFAPTQELKLSSITKRTTLKRKLGE